MKLISRILVVTLVAALLLGVPMAAQATTNIQFDVANAEDVPTKGNLTIDLTGLSQNENYEAYWNIYRGGVMVLSGSKVLGTGANNTELLIPYEGLTNGTMYSLNVAIWREGKGTTANFYFTTRLTDPDPKANYTYTAQLDGATVRDDYVLPMVSGVTVPLDAPAKELSGISYMPVEPKVGKWNSGMLGTPSTQLEKDVDYTIGTAGDKPAIVFTDAFMEKLPTGKHTLFISFKGKLIKVAIEK